MILHLDAEAFEPLELQRLLSAQGRCFQLIGCHQGDLLSGLSGAEGRCLWRQGCVEWAAPVVARPKRVSRGGWVFRVTAEEVPRGRWRS